MRSEHYLFCCRIDDGDVIPTGAELRYWNATRGLPMDGAVNYTLNPDVDGDNITDGKEINGYEVKIITGWKSDGTPISEMRYISPDELDPLIPYRNSTGVLLDTDKDGIPDVVESWFSNSSIATSSAYQNEFKSRFGDDLFNQYSWVIDYFKTVKREQNESAAEQWLRDQFNPLIVDHTPPIITKFKLTWIIVTDSNFPYVHLYAHVHVSVRDVGRIEWVNVTDKNNGEVWANYVGSTFFDGQHNFSASLLSDGVTGSVRINLTTYDHAGNYFYGEKKLDGLVNASLNALAALWGQLWAALVAVGKAMAKAVNFILEWVENLIKQALDAIHSPLRAAYNDWANHIAPILIQLGVVFGVISQKDAMVKGINVKQSDGNNEALKRQAVLMFLTALFAGTFGLLIMNFAEVIIALEWVITIVEYVLQGGQAAALIGNVIANIVINYKIFELVFELLASALIGEVIGTLLTHLIPPDSAFWAGNVPSTIVSIGVVIWQYRKTDLLGYGFGKWNLCFLLWDYY